MFQVPPAPNHCVPMTTTKILDIRTHKMLTHNFPKKNHHLPPLPLQSLPHVFSQEQRNTHTKNTPSQQLQPIKNTLEDHNSPKRNSPACDIVFSSPDNPNAARSKKALVLGRVAKARFTRQHAARSSAPHSVCTGQVIFFNENQVCPAHSIHVQCVYLHLVDFYGKCIGKHTIHGCRGRYTLSCCYDDDDDYYYYYHCY